jgi:hypothetical protein
MIGAIRSTTMLLLVLSLVCAVPVNAQESHVLRDLPAAHYQILDAGLFGSISALQKKVDEASRRGYAVVGGFERVVIMLREAHDERSVITTAPYTTGGKGDIESLERPINAAAATGFRLLPNAILTSLHVALMERRTAGAPSLRATYYLLSFTTHGETSAMCPGRLVGGDVDTELIDEWLARMAIAGYRLVALATRTVEGDKHRHRELIVFFERETGAPVIKNVREAARRYHVVIAATAGEFEGLLNQAAAARYGLLATATDGFPEIIAVVEKLPAAVARPAYRILAPRSISKLPDALSRAAASGWVPHSGGIVDPSGGRHDLNPVLLVVERRETSPPGDFLVLAAKRSSKLAKELNQATAAGLELVAGGAGRGELLLLLRR